MRRFVIIAACALSLSACAGLSPSLSISQQDSETAYTVAALGTDTAMKLGKMSADSAGTACVADALAYNLLIAGRNVADGVNYAPADNAHKALQTDGAKLAPDKCTPL